MVQWLRFCAPSAGKLGAIPGGGSTSTCHKKDQRSHVPQLRLSAAKQIFIFFKIVIFSRKKMGLKELKKYLVGSLSP